MKPVDLRSDTTTQPTAAMRDAMMSAPLGDDVFGDDPTVIALQEKAAKLFDKEAALFVPSGTMSNLVAIRSHTEPGDEIILESNSHIFLYEGGGFAAVAGTSVRTVEAPRGLMNPADVEAMIRPEGGLSHFPITKMICVENTSNRGGGSIYAQKVIDEIGNVAKSNDLVYHLDGARVFNAAVGSDSSVETIGAPFDSISFCLSKGLGCPIGSVLVGTRTVIDRAHRFRKMFGGGMRQAGVLAAAGIHALDHHVARLADDHRRARGLAEALSEVPGVKIDLEHIETNMIYIDISELGEAAVVVDKLAEQGILITAVNPTSLRAVTHLDVDDDGISKTIQGFRSIAG